MIKLLFYTYELSTWGLKIKSFALSNKLEIEKWKVLLRATDAIGRLLFFFYFRVTNSKLKNKKCYFEVLVQRMKK